MRTTITIDDELFATAQQLSGLRGATAVVHAGLQALISRESARHLTRLGGTERTAKLIPRRLTVHRGATVCDSKLLQLRRVAAIKVKKLQVQIAEASSRFPALSLEFRVK